MRQVGCQLETLLRSESCEIQYCDDCGLIHLTVGSLTLRLNENHFKELSRNINTGLIQLHSQRLSEKKAEKSNIRTLHS